MSRTKSPLARLLACAALFALSSAALAQDYPAKPIKIIQGFGAGGNGDTTARILAQGMSIGLGQQIIVEAKTGAGGNIASEAVAKSPADGYTLVLLTGGHAVSAALYKSLPFDPVDDFAMVSAVTFFPFVISVRADHPAKSLAEFIVMAKKSPGTLKYSSVGIGSTQHLAGELLASSAGVQLLHVPYRGGGAPLEALLRGDVDIMIDTVTFTSAQIRGGKVRALAVTNPVPWPALPGVPAAADTVPGYEVRSWTGLAAPRGTSPEIIERLNLEARRALALPEIKKRFEDLGNEVRPTSSGELRAHIASEIAKWKRVVEQAKIERQ
jgi:tripartite-type tricarboxylate transporter receptor subunit TctC